MPPSRFARETENSGRGGAAAEAKRGDARAAGAAQERADQDCAGLVAKPDYRDAVRRGAEAHQEHQPPPFQAGPVLQSSGFELAHFFGQNPQGAIDFHVLIYACNGAGRDASAVTVAACESALF